MKGYEIKQYKTEGMHIAQGAPMTGREGPEGE